MFSNHDLFRFSLPVFQCTLCNTTTVYTTPKTHTQITPRYTEIYLHPACLRRLLDDVRANFSLFVSLIDDNLSYILLMDGDYADDHDTAMDDVKITTYLWVARNVALLHTTPFFLFNGEKITYNQGAMYVSLADYCAMSETEVSIKERDLVELLKVGCAGWWFVKLLGNVNIGCDFPSLFRA